MKTIILIFLFFGILLFSISGCRESSKELQKSCQTLVDCTDLEPISSCMGVWDCVNNECTFVCEPELPDSVGQSSCIEDTDCVPAQCCHPTAVVNVQYAPDCSAVSCDASCQGPLDCGAGKPVCGNGTCIIEPLSQ